MKAGRFIGAEIKKKGGGSMNGYLIGTAASLLLLIGSAPGVVRAMDGPPGRGGHMGPPPGAIEVCKDKSEGTSVTFTTPRGETVKATCEQINGQLVAVPEEGFGGPKVPPPGEKQNGD